MDLSPFRRSLLEGQPQEALGQEWHAYELHKLGTEAVSRLKGTSTFDRQTVEEIATILDEFMVALRQFTVEVIGDHVQHITRGVRTMKVACGASEAAGTSFRSQLSFNEEATLPDREEEPLVFSQLSYDERTDLPDLAEELAAEVEALMAWHLLPREPRVSWPNFLFACQTYALLMAMVMLVAVINGEMMSYFLWVMEAQAEPEHSKTEGTWLLTSVATLLLPFCLFLGCLCIFSCICLLAGQIASVSFARCRAMMACTMHMREHSMPVICKLLDFWFHSFWWWLIVCVGLAAVLDFFGAAKLTFGVGFRLFSMIWQCAVLFVLLWAALTILLHIICDFCTAKDPETRRRIHLVHNALARYNIKPGCMTGRARLLLRCVDEKRQRTSLSLPQTSQSDSASRRQQAAVILASAGVLILCGRAIYLVVLGLRVLLSGRELIEAALMSIWILVALMGTGYLFVENFREKMMRTPFFVGIFISAIAVDGFLGFGLKMAPLISGRPVPVPLEHGPRPWVYENLDLGTRQTGRQHIPYPVCFMQWGQGVQMKVLDLAILSSYSYDAEASSYLAHGEAWNATMASFVGKGLRVEILLAQDYFKVGRVVAFRFLQEGAEGGTIVLVVKGSSEAFDFYADAGLWAGIASFQVFMIVIPLLDQLPNGLFVCLLKWLPSTNNHVFSNVHEVYESLVQDPRYAKDSFMITGHSLGGGIATAAGGSLGIPAVSFSGPGSHFSRHRFGTTQERAYRSALTVKPEIDFIHKIDRHDDMSQYIDCRDASGAYRSFATCHSIRTTICELWRSCGDHRGRDFREMCSGLLEDMSLTGALLGRPGLSG